MAESLGPNVEFGHRLSCLKRTAGGRYRLSFEHGNGTADVTADLVVLAIPFAVLAGIDTHGAGFTALKKKAIAQQGRGHKGKLQVQFAERRFGNGNSYADTGYQNSWEATRTQAGSRRILVFYSGGNVTDGMSTQSPYATINQPGGRRQAAAGRAGLLRSARQVERTRNPVAAAQRPP